MKLNLASLAGLVVVGVAAGYAAAPAHAGDTAPPAAKSTYVKERADCEAGRTAEDRATCLKEAGAALAEARRARLDNGEDARALRENALQRCRAQPPQDREACERLARGEGTVSGSVGGGGLIKEVVTPVIEPAPAAMPAEPAPAR